MCVSSTSRAVAVLKASTSASCTRRALWVSSLNFADATQLVEGIPNLLGGMRFAFGTSVAGISCSLLFNMLNRISQGSSYRAIDDFVSSFTQLAMSRPLDNDVQLICQNQDRNHMLQGINETLVDRLAENVGLAITRSMNPVSASMDRFIIGATRNQIEGVNRIVGRFLEEMNASLGGNFDSLGNTMHLINEHQLQAADQVSETLASARGIVQDAANLHSLTEQLITRFDNYVAELQINRSRDESFENRSSELLSQMEKQNQSMTLLMDTLSKRVEALPDQHARESTDQALAGIREITGSLNESVRSISETLTALSEEVCVSINSLKNARKHKKELNVLVGCIARIKKVHAVICAKRPVVVLT